MKKKIRKLLKTGTDVHFSCPWLRRTNFGTRAKSAPTLFSQTCTRTFWRSKNITAVKMLAGPLLRTILTIQLKIKLETCVTGIVYTALIIQSSCKYMNTTSARTQLIIRALQVVISSWKELKFTFLKDGAFQNLAVHLLLAQR